MIAFLPSEININKNPDVCPDFLFKTAGNESIRNEKTDDTITLGGVNLWVSAPATAARAFYCVNT